ncbi:hypothetical protein DV737_g5150, partial [Chaetothyriales sp. CBS 132003]
MADTSPHLPPATATITATATEMPPPKLASAATTSMAISVDPSRASALNSALSSVLARMQTASSQRQAPPSSRRSSRPPRLVAVSKLKPASDILALHQPPASTSTATLATPATSSTPRQIHFGENYTQELIEKSRLLPRSIKWHMIGGLQSNKCRELARQVRNLWAVESVDSVKKAGLLEKGRAELLIFVQVNTSGEASKAGVAAEGAELVQLCRYVREQCPHLQLQGLMTIGAIARSQQAAQSGNEDFECLKGARERVVRELGLEEEELELSMGMSEDFEAAIVQGSDEVRVGTTIFGARPPKG